MRPVPLSHCPEAFSPMRARVYARGAGARAGARACMYITIQ
jgi:hypothetical protein